MEERLDVVVDSSSAKRGIDALASAMKNLITSTTGAQAAATKLFDMMTKGLSKLETAFFNLKSVLASFAVVIGIFRHLGDEITRFQAFISAMSVSTGGVKEARAEYAFLMSMADRLGISITSLSHNYSQMAAAATHSGMSMEQLREIFESFSIAARVMHLSNQDTRLMFYSLTQMVSKGVVSMEELRRQLGEKLPGAMNIAAKSLGVSMPELENAIRKGIVNSAKFLPFFADAVKQTFSPGLQNAMKAFDAEVNRLNNTMQKMVIVFYDLGVADAFSGIIKELNRIMSDPQIAQEFAKAIKAISDGVTKFLKTINKDTVRDFVENFTAALIKMAEIITNQVMPVIKLLAQWIGKIVAAWAIIKGIAVGAAVGTAVGGPGTGTIAGGAIGGLSAAGVVWAVDAELDRIRGEGRPKGPGRFGYMGFNKSNIAFDGWEQLTDPPKGAYKPKGSLADVTGAGGPNKEYETAVANLKKRDAMLETQNSIFVATSIDIQAGKYGVLTQAQKDNLLSLAALAQQQQSYNEQQKQLKLDTDSTAKAVQQETDQQKKLLDSKIRDMEESFMTEEQLLEKQFIDRNTIIADAKRMERITFEKEAELLLYSEEQYLRESNELKKKKMTEAEKIAAMSYRAQTIAVLDEITSMTAGVAQHSRKMFELNKLATMANIILKTPDAIASAYTFGARFGGHFGGLAMGTLAAGVMAVQLAAAKKASFGGSSGGGSGISGGGGDIPLAPVPSFATGEPTSQTVIQLTIEGNIVGNTEFVNNTIIPALRDAIDNRDVTIISPNSRQAAELTS